MLLIAPNGKEFEIEQKEGRWHIDGRWWANDSAFAIFLTGQIPAKRKRNPCIREYPWQCPYSSYICMAKGKRVTKDLVEIIGRNYLRKTVRLTDKNGQVDLFPRSVWVRYDGLIKDQVAEPKDSVDVVCKKMALASMEWLKRHENFQQVYSWQIRPFKWDQEWVDEQREKAGQCVFDEL